MARSMTGFGRAEGVIEGDAVSVEIAAVNHRFLDCSVRLPAAWTALEPVVKDVARNCLSRGRLTIAVNRRRSPDSQRQTVTLDVAAARQYFEASRELVHMLGTLDSLSLNTLARMDGVFCTQETQENLDKIQTLLAYLVKEALGRLDAMRRTEGAALTQELTGRVTLMRESLAAIETRLPDLNAVYEKRLRERIAELAGDVSLSEERIAIEIALIADKGDVTEETVRLKTHFDHFLELLASSEPTGRELNFLTQELLREINTLGSKVRDSDVVKEVLRMKSELERIREQVQNVE